jgi:hypothetical protein
LIAASACRRIGGLVPDGSNGLATTVSRSDTAAKGQAAADAQG